MSIIGKLREKWKAKRERKQLPSAGQMRGTRIETPWGDVPEGARRQAAINMRLDHHKRDEVEKLLANQLFGGDIVRGREESMRRYPEAYENS